MFIFRHFSKNTLHFESRRVEGYITSKHGIEFLILIAVVKKKWKDKRFAAKVDRSIIERGATMMEMPLDTIISMTIEGMAAIASDLELDGRLAEAG